MVGKKLTLILNPELAQMLETLKNTEAFRERSQAEMLRTLIRAGPSCGMEEIGPGSSGHVREERTP